MNKKRIFSLIVFLVLFSICGTSFAATAKSSITTMELVEDNICEMNLNDMGTFTKKLTNIDTEKKQATLTLTVTNTMENEGVTRPVELFLLLDNSHSMSLNYKGKKKIQYVTETATTFVNSLFDHFENIKIGVIGFSSVDPVADSTQVLGTENDAKLLLSLSESSETVKSTINAYSQSEGPYTNIEAGLKIAENNFTNSTDSKKYIILISDGVPNLSLDKNNTLTYSGENAQRTKTKLQSMETAGYSIFSVLMGLNENNAQNPMAPKISDGSRNMTYGELAQEIFGTPSNPTVGKFYNIDYENLAQTVNENIYNTITYVKDNTLKNIVIKDYFPEEIINNFNFEYVASPNIGEVSTEINKDDNSITWTIELLKEGETATLSYNLILKDEYDKDITNKVLPTNEKVDIDFETATEQKDVHSDVSPKIKLTLPDDTVAKDPIPQTGKYINIVLGITAISIVAFVVTRIKNINKMK